MKAFGKGLTSDWLAHFCFRTLTFFLSFSFLAGSWRLPRRCLQPQPSCSLLLSSSPSRLWKADVWRSGGPCFSRVNTVPVFPGRNLPAQAVQSLHETEKKPSLPFGLYLFSKSSFYLWSFVSILKVDFDGSCDQGFNLLADLSADLGFAII